MSYQAVEAVMRNSKTVGTDRLVLMVIATYADAKTHDCHCGYQSLAEKANICERTVIYTIKNLEKSGELLVERGTGRGHLTRYQITLPIWERVQQDASFTLNKPIERVKLSAPLKGETDRTLSDKGCKEEIERVKNEPLKGEKSTSAYKDIEPEETSKEPKRARAEEGDFESLQVKAFVKAFPNQPASIHLSETLAVITDLEAWDEVLKIWRTNRYSVRNLSGMLEKYHDHVAKKGKSKAYDGFWNRYKKPQGANLEPVPAVTAASEPSKPALAARARAGGNGRLDSGARADQGKRPAPPVSLRTRFPREAPVWKTIDAGRPAVRVEQVEERDDLEFLFGPMGTSEQ